MNTQETLYNGIVTKMKDSVPVLEDPDGMLENIMLEVGQLKPIPKQNKVITVLSRTSGIAAAFLLALFVYETFFIQDHAGRNNVMQSAEYSLSDTYYSLSHQLKEGDFTDKKQIVLSIMAQEQQQEKERRIFYAGIFNYAKNK